MYSAEKNGTIYQFDEFQLIPDEGLLLRNGEPVPLNPKAFRVLTLLVERNGHLVEKSELLDLIWENSFVEEGSLSKAIWFVRQALADTSKERFIQTVPRRGYRFVFPVSMVTHLSGAFRLSDLHGGDKTETVFPADQTPITKVSGAEASVSRDSAKTSASETGPDEHYSEVFVAFPNRRALLSRWAVLATLATIVVITTLLGYGLVRKASVGSPRSIVVLPVAPINSVDGNLLFEFGIAESIINQVGSLEGFRVRPLSSVRDYRGQNADPLLVGREQKADYVLVPNYQIADGRIKVTAQLYNVNTGNVEDTFEIEKDATKAFAAQNAIAAEIGNRLMARFKVSRRIPLKGRGTNNEEAYALYQQAVLLIDKRSSENSKKAREYLEKAVAVDPSYAQAWAGIALAVRHSGRSDAANIHQEIIEAANKALAIDSNVSDAYTALCYDKLHHDYDFAGAEINCKQAIQVDPNSSTAHRAYCWLLRYSGRYNEALAEIRTAIDLEPISYVNQRDYGYVLYRAGRFDEAAEQWKRLIDLDPADDVSYDQLIRTLQTQGNEADAFRWFIKLLTLRQVSPETIQQYTDIYRTSGWRGVLLERAKDPKNAPGGGSDFAIAKLYARVGEKDKAFEYLERSFQQREWNFIGLWESPELDSLRDDPRYQDLVRRVEAR